MTKLQALTALRDKVKVGDIKKFLDMQPLAGDGKIQNAKTVNAWGAYNGSLDAAKALHEAVLPGWSWYVPHANNFALYSKDLSNWSRGYNNNPARAWLLAILEALIAQEGEATQ